MSLFALRNSPIEENVVIEFDAEKSLSLLIVVSDESDSDMRFGCKMECVRERKR
jgi:hypothetical protein